MVCLIVISSSDIASVNQGESLLLLGDWNILKPVENCKAFSFMHARMWWLPASSLLEDDLDSRWELSTNEVVDEVVFPSRHSASSGQPSLTIHPIGVLDLPRGTLSEFGGKSGYCPPPSPRIASWWRELLRVGVKMNEFTLSLEATHHGPWLNKPSLFIEIGSTESTWGHLGAAKLLADLIWKGLGLDGGDQLGKWDGSGIVVITLGGGHYTPRANSLASHSNVWMGHMLANYALEFEKDINSDMPGGLWKESVKSAVKSTMKSFPGGNVVASIEKKSFKGWQRSALKRLLADLDIPVLRTHEILALIE